VKNAKCTGNAEVNPFDYPNNYHFFRNSGCTNSSNRLNMNYYKVCKKCYDYVLNPKNKINGRYAFQEKNGKRAIIKK